MVVDGWDTIHCGNHPDRIAIERCEVCNKPLCAYCLYYTEDGQRLCAEHAEQARKRGLRVEEPGAYADQLIGAQAGVMGKRKRAQFEGEDRLYRGNSNDLTALVGLIVGVVSLAACCGAGYCLPIAGFILSLVAVLNAKKAHDPSRTRKFGVVGLLLSGMFVLLLGACILFYGISFQRLVSTSVRSGPVQVWRSWPPRATPAPSPTPSATPLPDDDLSGVAAWKPAG